MRGSMFVVVVSLASVVIAATAVTFLRAWIGRLQREAEQALRNDMSEEIFYGMEPCNFLGQLSRGYAQLRGNGLLALTDRYVRFRMLYPRREISIPLDAITAVSTTRSFLGKRKGKELLRIDFRNGEGKEDACAFLVRSARRWTSILEALNIGGQSPFAS